MACSPPRSGFRVFLFLVPYVFVWVAGFGVASLGPGRVTGPGGS